MELFTGNLKAEVSANSVLINLLRKNNNETLKIIIQNQNSIIQNQKNILANQIEIKNTQLKILSMQNTLTLKIFAIDNSINKFNIKFSDEYLHKFILSEICMYHNKQDKENSK